MNLAENKKERSKNLCESLINHATGLSLRGKSPSTVAESPDCRRNVEELTREQSTYFWPWEEYGFHKSPPAIFNYCP
ncbi:hypothetical protein J6590_006427 [Homalodisca vitripennis]|nr:hypothetical protein J6590_006427 [Homalodisca vitripennis]